MINQLNNFILKVTGLVLIKPFPKHSIRFAKEYFKDKKIDAIEIGTFKGVNAKDILKNLNLNKIYLIDPWEEYIGYEDGLATKKVLDNAYNIVRKKLKNYEDKIIYIKEYSSNAVDKVPQADYIYIDGNHTYDFVLEDCKNYWPKVKEGGILAGHDIDWITTLNAVQDFCKEMNLNFQVAGQDWWIVKKDKTNSIEKEVYKKK